MHVERLWQFALTLYKVVNCSSYTAAMSTANTAISWTKYVTLMNEMIQYNKNQLLSGDSVTKPSCNVFPSWSIDWCLSAVNCIFVTSQLRRRQLVTCSVGEILYNFLLPWIIAMILTKNYENTSRFIKVMQKLLMFSFFLGHSVHQK